MECKNCQKEGEGDYCSHCGQRFQISPISLKAVVQDFFQALNLERGFLHTLIELSKSPGKAIREYVAGKRIIYMSPLRYLFFMVAIGALASYFVSFDVMFDGEVDDQQTINSFKEAENIIKEYFSLISIISVPFYALFSWLFFLKHKQNFAKHLVVNAYVTAHNNLIFLMLLPFYMQTDKTIYLIGNYGILVLSTIYIIWVYIQYFNPKYKLLAVFKALLVYLLTSVVTQFGIGVVVGYLNKT